LAFQQRAEQLIGGLSVAEDAKAELLNSIKKDTHEDDAVHLARLHEFVLRQEVKDMPLMPIEDIEAFMSLSLLRRKLREIKQVANASLLEGLVDEVQAGRQMATQLRDSVKQSMKDLKGNINKRLRDQKRDVEKKRQEEEKKKKAMEAEANKGRPKDTNRSLLTLDLSKNIGIKAFINVEEFTKAKGDGSINIDEPFFIHQCDMLLKDPAGEVLTKTLTSWSVQFRGAAQSKGPDRRTQAPITDKMGSKAAMDILAAASPGAVSCNAAPGIDLALNSVWLYGFMPDMTCHLPEPGCYGSVRLQAGGEVSLACISISALHRHLLSMGTFYTDNKKPTFLEILKWSRDGCRQDLIDSASANGVRIFYGIARDGTAIVVPPGHLLSIKPLNNRQVYGLRKSFMSNTPAAVASFSLLQELHKNVPALEADAEKFKQALSALPVVSQVGV
jgi:hypothetical protein